MGAAFMATEECTVHPNVKQAIVQAIDRDIVACGASIGEPSWQIKNKLAEQLMKIESENPWTQAADMVREVSEGSLSIAALEGDVEEKGTVMVGQAVGLIHSIKLVKELVIEFCTEWQKWLDKSYQLA